MNFSFKTKLNIWIPYKAHWCLNYAEKFNSTEITFVANKVTDRWQNILTYIFMTVILNFFYLRYQKEKKNILYTVVTFK